MGSRRVHMLCSLRMQMNKVEDAAKQHPLYITPNYLLCSHTEVISVM